MGARNDLPHGLTERQREVLELVARGKTNFEVAQELGITLDGAKWHLREIMAKFGCDTREEAVAIWQGRPSGPQRVASRLARPFAIFGTALGKAAAALAAGGVAVAAVALITMTGAEDGGGAGSAKEGQAAQDVRSASTPGQATPIAFRSCGTTTFRRPAIAEMAQAFTNPRFAEFPPADQPATSERPGPSYFSFYLSKVYQLTPHAVSANIEPTALSGVQQNGSSLVLGLAPEPCDRRFLQDFTLAYYLFRFIDLVPRSSTLAGITLTVEAELLPGSSTLFTLPHPAVARPPSKDISQGLPPFKELRVTTADGVLMYTRGREGTAQYSADGNLEFATNAFGGTDVTFEVRVPQTLVAYRAAGRGGGVVGLRDEHGISIASGPRQTPPTQWSEVFRKELAPGRYTVDGAGGVLVVPAGTPLP